MRKDLFFGPLQDRISRCLMLLTILLSAGVWGQYSLGVTGTYTQDFNNLSSTAAPSSAVLGGSLNNVNTNLNGWFFLETGTSANTTYTASDGTINSGETYSLGTSSTTERALGGLQSGSVVPTIGFYFTNNTGSTITSLKITYTGEQWRLGVTGRNDRLDFQYSTGATSLSNGTWVDVDALDFVAPVSTGTAGALNGNATANKTLITSIITGLSVANGSRIFIRWNDFNATGIDDALGVDDFSLEANPTANPTLTISSTSVTGMDYVFGSGPSAPAKTFTVAGSNLAPSNSGNRYVYIEPTGTNFEFSLDNTTFHTAGEIISFPTGSGFSATTIYTRLKAGLPAGNYTDNTSISYYNAPAADLVKSISLSGTVSAPPATITTGTISGSSFCVTESSASSAFNVPFTSTGTFTGNTYTAQLSNASGVFSSPVNIGTLLSNANSGIISVVIPANTATGTGYRIRVIASNPSTTGSTNVTNLVVNLAKNSIAPTATQNIIENTNGTALNVTEQSTANSRVWKYGTSSGIYGTTTAITGTTFTPNFAVAGTYYVICESTFTCGVVRSNEVVINVTKPTITIGGTIPSLFTYAQGQGPSSNQVITVEGASLSSDIVVTVPGNWEISTNALFPSPASSITLAKNTSNIVISTNIYIRLKAGLLQGTYEFSTDDDLKATSSNANIKTVDLDGEVTAPKAELNVRGVFSGGTTSNIIPNGDTTPSTLDNTEFAATSIGASQTKIFRLENIGGLALNVTSISLDNSSDFNIAASAPYNIASSSYQDFTITFNPSDIGDRTATITIASSDFTDSSYTYTVKGVGNNAEISVAGNSIEIPSGSTAISTTNNTLIGNANLNVANPTTVSKNFVISNTGNVALTVSGITFTGADASQFSASPASTSIAAGSTGIIAITFTPTSEGVKNAIISIVNNDVTGNENPYTFAVRGNAVNYVTCAAGEPALLYETGFESSEGYVASTNYAYDTPFVVGSTNPQNWSVVRGNVSTTQAIATQSLNLRLYTSPSPYPYAITNFEIDNVAKVTFKARTADGLPLVVSYSINGGTTYLNAQSFNLTGVTTNVPTYTYVLSSTASINDVKLKFEVPTTAIRPTSSNKQLVIDDIKFYGQEVAAEKTWNGTAWSGDGLPPTSSQKAIIDGDLTLPYTIGSTVYNTLQGCECQINAGKTLNIGITDDITKSSTPANAVIQGKIVNNGAMVLASDSNLQQVDPYAENSFLTANFVVKRFAKLPKMGYTYWSSPVSNQNLYAFSDGGTTDGTPKNRFWQYDEATDNFKNTGAFLLNETSIFETGKGYAIRGQNRFDVPILKSYEFLFAGVPNNGDVSFSLLKNTNTANNSKGYNLVGNPYPSNIDFDELYELNKTKIYGTAYFWTNSDMSVQTQQGSTYKGNNYAIYNLMGGVPSVDHAPDQPENPVTNPTPTNIIKVGQGFIVKTKNGSNNQALNFNNSLRVTDSGVFFNNKTNIEKDRFWMKLTAPSGIANTILVGYISKATNDFEIDYDGELFIVGSDSFYSLLGGRKLAIQGKNTFNNEDKVNLANVYSQNGNYKISLKNAEGIFNETQNIYLKDKLLNKTINLSNGDYTFTAVKGTDATRFEIGYKDDLVLGTDAATKSDFIVYKDGMDYVIKSSKSLGKVEVYDAAGRMVVSKKTTANSIRLDAAAFINGVYIIKAENSGDVRTKKFIK